VGDRVRGAMGRERSGKGLKIVGIGLIYSSLRTSIRGERRSRSRSRSGRKRGTGLRLANIWRYRGRRGLQIKRTYLRIKKKDLQMKRRDLRMKRRDLWIKYLWISLRTSL
jgi:hypothetical protein